MNGNATCLMISLIVHFKCGYCYLFCRNAYNYLLKASSEFVELSIERRYDY